MKVKTKYRYIIWTESGQAHSTTMSKMNRTPRSWTFDLPPEIDVYSVDSHREPQLDGCCPGDWSEKVYDTHDEEDVKLIDVMLSL